MKPIVIGLTVIICVLGVAYIGRDSYAHKKVVFDYCNNSRISDTASEQTCGELQDFYHMEFLCNENNNKPTTHCWVEQH